MVVPVVYGAIIFPLIFVDHSGVSAAARFPGEATPRQTRRGLIIGLFATVVLVGGAIAQAAASSAYITNQVSNTVSVIDTETNTVVATIMVGGAPFGVAVNQDGTRAYVTNETSGNVSVIDTATNTVVATVPVGHLSDGVAVNPIIPRVYVTNFFENTLSVIDTATNTVVTTLPVGTSPEGVAVNPAGTRVYVANSFEGTVSVIDTATNTVVATVTVEGGPFGVAVNSRGDRAYVTNEFSPNHVSVIDTVTNTVVATVTVGNFPSGVALNAFGTRAYVANPGDGTVSVIDTATNTVVATVTVGMSPVAFGVFIAQPFFSIQAPTLSEWGLILTAVSLLVAGAWRIAGQPRLLSRPILVGLLAGQGVVLVGAALYAVLIARIGAHDAFGAWLCGGLVGVLVACCREGRGWLREPRSR
jgi:YVTN family beta-propeller protein